MKKYTKLNSYFIFLLFFCVGLQANPPKHLKTELFQFTHQKDQYLVLKVTNQDHWHTYWKNPGDAGKKWEFSFKHENKDLNQSFQNTEWQAPKTFIADGDVVSYGFDQTYHFFFKVDPQALKTYSGKELSFQSKYLICKNICLPGQEKHLIKISKEKIDLPQKDFAPVLSSLPAVKQKNDFKLETYFSPKSEKILLKFSKRNVSLEDLKKIDVKSNLIYLFPNQLFTYFREEAKYNPKRKEVAIFYDVEWNGKYLEPEIALPKNGTFTQKQKIKIINNEQTPSISNFQFNQLNVVDDASMKQMKKKYKPLQKFQI